MKTFYNYLNDIICEIPNIAKLDNIDVSVYDIVCALQKPIYEKNAMVLKNYLMIIITSLRLRTK